MGIEVKFITLITKNGYIKSISINCFLVDIYVYFKFINSKNEFYVVY